MVRRSHYNWLGHLVDVYTEVRKMYGEKNAEQFISYYHNAYDRFGRSYIDWKLAIALYDEKKALKRMGTRFYACIGIGGAGKTTLMKNVLYFMDHSMYEDCNSRIVTKMLDAMEVVNSLPKDSQKAILIDEPDDENHAVSKTGKVIRKVLGKWRQHRLVAGICATDVTDIPPYMWKKIHCLFFCPDYGQVWLFQNKSRELKFPIQRIKKEIVTYGYDLLVSLRKDAFKFNSSGNTPLDHKKKEYEDIKWKDYKEDLKLSIEMLKNPNIDKDKRNLEIFKLSNQGVSRKEIAKKFNITTKTVGVVLNS